MTIEKLIGNTPLVQVNPSGLNEKVKIYTKLEGNNPAGSVKDRTAYFMINEALKEGSLKRTDTIIEATSGNTGIALAMIAASFNIDIKLVMPDNATPERVSTMKAYGAEVILTPAEKTIEYSRLKAKELSDARGYVILDQFNNPNNKLAHIKTTGPEIWRDTEGQITHFVSSMGTTGTITGTSNFLKSQNEQVKIIGVQPITGERIPGIRTWSKAFLPGIYEEDKVDQIEYVTRAQAIESSRELAMNEGLFVGISSGGAYTITKKISQQIEEGLIVFISCDRGDRYLSSDLISS